MLAAMLGVFVVMGAATGFLLTVMQRQAAVLQASALEDQHEALAEIMNDSIKSAVDFQIYATAPSDLGGGSLMPGNSSGDYLVCVNQQGTRVFRFIGTTIDYKQIENGAVQDQLFPGASRVSKSGNESGEPIFNSNLGIIQAQWNVDTAVDRVPFNVLGVPLQMQ
jgi:hypothetical protein